jgi:hypothetical protein
VSGDSVAFVPHDDLQVHGVEAPGRGDRVAQAAPADGVQDLRQVDFIRVPSPAARTMTAAGREVVTTGDPTRGCGRLAHPSRVTPTPLPGLESNQRR